MAENSHVKSEVLNRVLAEVQGDDDAAVATTDVCVICLDQISEQATAKPCSHANFDYLCLISWLDQQNSCPLCKSEIQAVTYKDKDGKEALYRVPKAERERRGAASRLPPERRPRYRRRRRDDSPPSVDAALRRRRQIYEHQLYSLHVGTNRISAYRDVQPIDFTSSPALVSRARAWIRRELRVFRYLDDGDDASTSTPPSPHRPQTSPSLSSSSSGRATLRSASNAEFLLEYMVAILKTVDIRAASGHAEDLVADFLGRETARLFLHELNSFLRSPYESPELWDRHVQHPEVPREAQTGGGARGVSGSRKRLRDHERRSGGAASGPGGEEDARRHRPRRRHLDRYIPD